MKSVSISIPLFLAFTANAEVTEKVDYCHDAKVNQDWKKTLTEFPDDPIIIKLAVLREGL